MTANDFVRQQLATTGWAPIHLEAAQMLRPEVARDFKTFEAWQRSPAGLPRAFPGAALLKARVPGFGDMLVLSRSTVFLAERMDWLGFPASAVELVLPAVRPSTMAAAEQSRRAPAAPKPNDRLERLRELAEQDPPAHDCSRRRDILAARLELANAEAVA